MSVSPSRTTVCKEVFDDNSLPSEEEIKEYAIKIGIDPVSEPHLLHFARDGLMQALPPDWKPCYDEEIQSWYYFNFRTGESRWEHPLDDVYRMLVKKGRSESVSSAGDDDSKTSIKEDLKSYEEAVTSDMLSKSADSLKPSLRKGNIQLAPLRKSSARKEAASTSPLAAAPVITSPSKSDEHGGPKPVKKVELLKADTRSTPASPTRIELSDDRGGADSWNIPSPASMRIDIDKMDFGSVSSRQDSAKKERLLSAQEKHPRSMHGRNELTLSGGGSMFLKSSKLKVESPVSPLGSVDSEPVVEVVSLSRDDPLPKGILRDQRTSLPAKPLWDLDPREMSYEEKQIWRRQELEEERKSVRFNLEKDLDIHFNVSDSEEDVEDDEDLQEREEEDWNSDEEDPDEERLIAGIKVSDILNLMDASELDEVSAKEEAHLALLGDDILETQMERQSRLNGEVLPGAVPKSEDFTTDLKLSDSPEAEIILGEGSPLDNGISAEVKKMIMSDVELVEELAFKRPSLKDSPEKKIIPLTEDIKLMETLSVSPTELVDPEVKEEPVNVLKLNQELEEHASRMKKQERVRKALDTTEAAKLEEEEIARLKPDLETETLQREVEDKDVKEAKQKKEEEEDFHRNLLEKEAAKQKQQEELRRLMMEEEAAKQKEEYHRMLLEKEAAKQKEQEELRRTLMEEETAKQKEELHRILLEKEAAKQKEKEELHRILLEKEEEERLRMQQESQKNVKAFRDRLDKETKEEIEEIQKEHEQHISELREQLSQEENVERARLQQELEGRMLEFEKELINKQMEQEQNLRDSMEKLLSELGDTLAAEREARSEAQRAEFASLLAAEKEKLESETKKQIEVFRQELAAKNREQLEAARAELEAEGEAQRLKLREEMGARQAELLEKHQQDLEEAEATLKENLASKIAERMSELEAAALDKVMRQLEIELEAKRHELLEEHRVSLQVLQEQHAHARDKIRKEYKEEEDILRKDHAERLEEMRVRLEIERQRARERELQEDERKREAARQEMVENSRVFEKLRCEKRLLEDKYRSLKEKYIRLKTDVKISIERRKRRGEGGGTTTGSETERSSSQHNKTAARPLPPSDVDRSIVDSPRGRARKRTTENVDGTTASSGAPSQSPPAEAAPNNGTAAAASATNTTTSTAAKHHPSSAVSPPPASKNLSAQLSPEIRDKDTAFPLSPSGVDSDNASSTSSKPRPKPVKHAESVDSHNNNNNIGGSGSNNNRRRRQLFGRLKSASTSRLIHNNITNNNNNNNNINNDTEEGSLSCSPVENLRRQLKKLEDLEDQFPVTTHTDTYLRYPFTDTGSSTMLHSFAGQFGSSELEFFRHRIHLERDSVRRAKDFLRVQRNNFQCRQRELKQRQLDGSTTARNMLDQLYKEERELTDMEVSLHRTRSLLGEKIIRLRHLEQSLHRVGDKGMGTSTGGPEDGTLSDLSSHSGSSGFSSTELGTDTPLGRSTLHRGTHYQESTEIIQSLENLNTEIREIWEVLNKQQKEGTSHTGVLVVDFLHEQRTINAVHYCRLLDEAKTAYRNKRRQLPIQNIIRLHGSVRPHAAALTQEKLEEIHWTPLEYPPYSPDLSSWNYHLFGQLKQDLGGQQFNDDASVEEFMRIWLRTPLPPPPLMYSDMGWPTLAGARGGTSVSLPVSERMQAYRQNPPYVRPATTVEASLVERTRSLRDWLRQARLDSTELVGPTQPTV
ncbi:centrosomal protein of 164 kDa [Anabrus simplex]|uniref:centrosomal protein of 164 kDa n=1 Tax=Anabrus simplex TaxID=316456 RepID=UPI0035A2E67D